MTQGRPDFLARRHLISSNHYLASVAGERMFARGGNAIDAGVAAGIALNVLERHLTDFGGVAPIMVFVPGMSEPTTLDGLGRWPMTFDLAAHRGIYGDDMPAGISRSVVPGAPDAWLTALASYGRLSLADVLEPSIELCDGFPVFPRLAEGIEKEETLLSSWPTSARVFLPDGRPPKVGDILVQRELGDLFRRLVSIERATSASGRRAAIQAARDDFYTGDIAEQIATFIARSGGRLTMEDLRRHRLSIEPPVHTTYRGVDVYACGPWSQGPIVPMTLNLLEGLDIGAMGPGTSTYWHHILEALKLSFADREAFFGDPLLVDVPIQGLLDKGYADERRQLIRPESAYPELPLPGNPWRWEQREEQPAYIPARRSGAHPPDTSYVCAVDEEGNAFSATPSDPGLSAPLVEGLGIIVSTRGAQLWTTPGHPSQIAPGKRPRLTPNPGMLMRAGKVLMPFGCPGGDAQPQAMVQVVCNVLDFGMSVQAAIEFPRAITVSFPWTFHPHAYEPGLVKAESRIDEQVRLDLLSRGHRLAVLDDFDPITGCVCAIRYLANGVLEGGADPRQESYALGW